jgi:hypothetical protein
MFWCFAHEVYLVLCRSLKEDDAIRASECALRGVQADARS